MPNSCSCPRARCWKSAEKEGAIPFDTPGAELHHRENLCTFDVIIQEYGLTDKALLRMARVINAADTDRLDADPLAAGFEAIAVGYGLRYPGRPGKHRDASSRSTTPCMPGAVWMWPGATS